MAAPVRLQRYLAAAGVAARRKAEDLITAGRVKVNGEVVRVLGTKVDPDRDEVEVDGEAVVALDTFYVLFNKPKACITAVTDDRGRPTVMDYLPNLPVPVKPVGRLDFYTEGVLLLTNDGELAARLLAPASHVPKTYHVKVHGQLTPRDIKQLRDGIQLDDGTLTMPAEVEVLPGESKHTWLAITIHEGKHRQIHRMIEALGHYVDKLQRVAFANLTFHNLRVGDARELTQQELNELRDTVGLDHKPVARGTWHVYREDTDIPRRARAKARAEAEAEALELEDRRAAGGDDLDDWTGDDAEASAFDEVEAGFGAGDAAKPPARTAPSAGGDDGDADADFEPSDFDQDGADFDDDEAGDVVGERSREGAHPSGRRGDARGPRRDVGRRGGRGEDVGGRGARGGGGREGDGGRRGAGGNFGGRGDDFGAGGARGGGTRGGFGGRGARGDAGGRGGEFGARGARGGMGPGARTQGSGAGGRGGYATRGARGGGDARARDTRGGRGYGGRSDAGERPASAPRGSFGARGGAATTDMRGGARRSGPPGRGPRASFDRDDAGARGGARGGFGSGPRRGSAEGPRGGAAPRGGARSGYGPRGQGSDRGGPRGAAASRPTRDGGGRGFGPTNASKGARGPQGRPGDRAGGERPGPRPGGGRPSSRPGGGRPGGGRPGGRAGGGPRRGGGGRGARGPRGGRR
ncbi:MAG TPA: pseudouridine synthase [Kofleriaceae bacterium]|nr:pseudouridine synthase [Kofleriaceae bacterium]